MKIFPAVVLVFGASFIPSQYASAFPVGQPFKMCSAAATGCLAPGDDGIIMLSWHPATSPLGQSVMWEAFYAGRSGGSNYYFIANIHTGMCLDVVDGAYHNGAQFRVNPCSAVSTSQWWKVQNYGGFGTSNIRNLPSGKCITVPLQGLHMWNGDPLVQYSCGNKRQFNQYYHYNSYP